MSSRLLRLWAFVATLSVGAAGSFTGSAGEAKRFVTLGTGQVDGMAYAVGLALCGAIDRAAPRARKCSVLSTEGSLDNLKALTANDFEFAIIQADVLHHAVTGAGVFRRAGPNASLATLLSLHEETFSMLARKGEGITLVSDLQRRIIGVGSAQSGQRATVEGLIAALGWPDATYDVAGEFSDWQQTRALCAGEIDVAVIKPLHPSALIRSAAVACGAMLVGVDRPALRMLSRGNDAYRRAVISKTVYPGMTRDVETFRVRMALVASASLPDAEAYAVTRAILGDLERLKRVHPALNDLDPKEMATKGLGAPLHAGAARFLIEAGLRKDRP